MGLLRMAARTAVVAGTATAVSGRVQRRQAERWQTQDDAAAYQQQQQYLQYAPPPPASPAPAAPAEPDELDPEKPGTAAEVEDVVDAAVPQLVEERRPAAVAGIDDDLVVDPCQPRVRLDGPHRRTPVRCPGSWPWPPRTPRR